MPDAAGFQLFDLYKNKILNNNISASGID